MKMASVADTALNHHSLQKPEASATLLYYLQKPEASGTFHMLLTEASGLGHFSYATYRSLKLRSLLMCLLIETCSIHHFSYTTYRSLKPQPLSMCYLQKPVRVHKSKSFINTEHSISGVLLVVEVIIVIT